MKKKNHPPEKFWRDFVSIYFSFCREKFNDVPSFENSSSPRDLKAIVTALRKRAEHAGVEWDYETATSRFHHFLEFAIQDKWLSENWLLSNLNRQKDKLFLNHSKQKK